MADKKPDGPPPFTYGPALERYYREHEEKQSSEKAKAMPSPTSPPVTPGEQALAPPPSQAMEGVSDGSYALIDKLSFGALPWFRDKVADLAGVSPEVQPRREEMRAAIEKRSPVANAVGGAIGTAVPTALAAGALPLAGAARGIVGGALAGGGVNLADQVGRKAFDDREIQGKEVGTSALLGALPSGLLTASTIVPRVIRGGVNAARGILQGADDAARAADIGTDIYRGAAAPTKAAKILGDPAGREAVSDAVKGGTNWMDDVAQAQRETLLRGAAPPPPAGPLAPGGRGALDVADDVAALAGLTAASAAGGTAKTSDKEERRKRLRNSR